MESYLTPKLLSNAKTSLVICNQKEVILYIYSVLIKGEQRKDPYYIIQNAVICSEFSYVIKIFEVVLITEK